MLSLALVSACPKVQSIEFLFLFLSFALSVESLLTSLGFNGMNVRNEVLITKQLSLVIFFDCLSVLMETTAGVYIR